MLAAAAAASATEQLTANVLAAVVAQAAIFVFKAETLIKIVAVRVVLQNVQTLGVTILQFLLAGLFLVLQIGCFTLVTDYVVQVLLLAVMVAECHSAAADLAACQVITAVDVHAAAMAAAAQ